MSAAHTIAWLTQTVADHPCLDQGQPPPHLLSDYETAVLRTLNHPKRRHDWLLGRCTAKKLLQTLAGTSWQAQDLSVLAAADGAPQLWRSTPSGLLPLDVSLTISHAQDVAFCALLSAAGWSVGADIECAAPRHPHFAAAYFSAGEQALLRETPQDQQDFLLTAIWSAKESALKALRAGLRLDTRRISCAIPPTAVLPSEWAAFPIHVLAASGATSAILYGWWRVWNGFTLTLAVAPTRMVAAGAYTGVALLDRDYEIGLHAAAAA